jgi:putative nucleotidyltransferase with HDIG domain
VRARVGSKAAEHEEAYLALVCRLGQLIESNDRYTYGHCERVAAYAVDIARTLGFRGEELTTVRIGAYLHDLGKVAVPHEILNKTGRLAREEIEVIRTHPVRGVELLAAIEFPWEIRPIIRWHHERYDGSGYPDGLCGDEIPISAQIIGIADAYDALTTTRSYRQAVSPYEALAEMGRTRRAWHPDVYGAFVATLTRESGRVA